MKKTKWPPATIPKTRLGRFARMGMAAGELAAGAAVEGLKRMARGEAPDFRGALLKGGYSDARTVRTGSAGAISVSPPGKR